MQIIATVNQKGGVGKSTLALHLAVAAEADGMGPVALVDTDPQATLLHWWRERAQPTPVMVETTTLKLPADLAQLEAGGIRLVVIDTPGRSSLANEEIIRLASLVLVPVNPSPADLWATTETVRKCQELHRPFAFVLARATRNAVTTVQAISALSQVGAVAPAIIHNRVGYAAALNDGRTVQELDPKSPGAQEIKALLGFVKQQLARADQPKSRRVRHGETA